MSNGKNRPTPALVLGIISIVVGLFGICSGFFGLIFKAIGAQATNMPKLPEATPGGVILLVIEIVLAVILIIAGIGLILVKNWARILALVYAVIQILVILVKAALTPAAAKAMLGQMPADKIPPQMVGVATVLLVVGSACCGLIYPIVLLVILNLKNMRAAFKGESAEPSPVSPP